LRHGLAAVVNGKYLHALCFASGFAPAIYFRFVSFPPARFNRTACFALYFPLVFLLASRAAQTKRRKAKEAAAL
jgi:hypothetical protein